jgi:hypothetical protein
MPKEVTDGTVPNIKHGLWQDVHTRLKEYSPICSKRKGGAQGHAISLCLYTQSVASGRLHLSSEQRTKQTAHQLQYGT